MKRFSPLPAGYLFLCVACFFLFLFPQSAEALSLEQGRIRLVLHEDTGRFSLYYLEEVKSDRYIPLFFDRDPRTSSLGLLSNNKILTLGPGSRFEQTLERTVDGARFIWISSSSRVTQNFRFVKSRSNSLVDGVEIEVTVKNTGRSVTNIGIHFLLDTNLGEDEKAHFITSDGEKIEKETGFSSSMPAYWISPGDYNDFQGLQGMLTGIGLTKPDRVLFANWKRINDELWNLDVRSNRNFNLPPYSINDSAVGLFFNAQRLSPGSTRKITTAIGAASGAGFSAAVSTAAGGTSSSLENVRKSISGVSLSGSSIEEDIIVVEDIISNIDALLANPSEVSEEKLQLLEEALSVLQERSESYEDSR